VKLLRYGPSGQERPAVLAGGTTAVDVGDALAATFGHADTPFLAHDRSVRLDELADLVARRGPGTREVDLDGVRIGPPLARPGKIVCIGLNYADHARESGATAPAEPIVFMKAPNTVVGPDDDVLVPPGSTKTDWEVELGVVIGRTARYLPDEDAADDVIAGYVVSNDVSERHYQLERGGQWVKGKSCETFNPLGPWLVTADEVPDPQRLRLTLSLNGQVAQDGSTADMIFGVRHVVHYLSQFMVLEPGDVINTGTPAGVGMGRTPPRYLTDGDVLELEIEGLGRQRQNVRQATAG
jgi:2-keto-4-pentenoate hydratase/2-oxohepta-3-ene-1,7-dioic acid hydratase in catechol pathway